MKKFWKKHSIYELKVYDSEINLVCTSKTRSAICCERLIHKLETNGYLVKCLPEYDKKIFSLARLRNLRNNIDKKFKIEKSKTEENVNKKLIYKKFRKLRELLKYLEGTKVPYFKVPIFLRSDNCSLKILSPVPCTVVDKDKEKRFILEYSLTNTLCNINSYKCEFEQFVDIDATTFCYEKLTNEKELFKFLKKIKREKQWDILKTNPWTLTLLGAFGGIVAEKLIGAIFNNQQEIILRIIK